VAARGAPREEGDPLCIFPIECVIAGTSRKPAFFAHELLCHSIRARNCAAAKSRLTAPKQSFEKSTLAIGTVLGGGALSLLFFDFETRGD
jgi:hypothetical protein